MQLLKVKEYCYLSVKYPSFAARMFREVKLGEEAKNSEMRSGGSFLV